MKKNRLLSLLLCFCLVLALLPTTALAASTLTGAYCSVSEPAAGKPLPTDVKLRALQHKATYQNATVTGYTWDGELDANGNAVAGNTYTIIITIEMNPDSDVKFSSKIGDGLRVNAKKATLVSVTDKKLVYSYSFTLGGDGKAVDQKAIEQANENHAAELASRWSLAEASKVENYPQGYPITLVVNDEALSDYFKANPDAYSYSHGSLIYYQFDGAGDIFHTLDGETIKTDKNSYQYQSRRITRVVYDYYRPDDPSIANFPNCKELWLSPKCDIEGILRTIGNFKYGDVERVFGTEDCTIFIPDSLYPNGPTYTDHPAPGCRVMLYSGDDVYAAARLGKEHAREWCTDHSYTYAYISEDRVYTDPTCCTDARFYYTCSKCGKIERNPDHTFYPTSGSWDSAEDGGKGTAHSYKNKVVTDEHYLGINADGDRVYLYACANCGKDWRQDELSQTYPMNAVQTREEYEYVMDRTRKSWSEGGTMYERCLANTTVGDDYNGRAYAIPKDAFVTAKMSDWATGEVLAASEAGLIDKALMGNDYTARINRLQFCSVAVKLAEEMAGKAITPAPSGTFTDTDNEYVRKASAAGITSGVGGGLFDPDSTLTRQQMAAFLYRALQWAKNNSDVEYTVYDPKLSDYTDAGQLADWAVEAMGFMNALGLISGTGGAALSPNGACTIEQAVAVANRSLYADRIGWYQNTGSDSYGDRTWIYFKNGRTTHVDAYGVERSGGVFDRDSAGAWKNLRPIKDR